MTFHWNYFKKHISQSVAIILLVYTEIQNHMQWNDDDDGDDVAIESYLNHKRWLWIAEILKATCMNDKMTVLQIDDKQSLGETVRPKTELQTASQKRSQGQ